MNFVEERIEGYKLCLDDFNVNLERIIKRNNGVKTTVDAWKAFSEVILWTHETKLMLPEEQKLQTVGGI